MNAFTHPTGLGLSGVAHQNGTVRFGTDPVTSALDLNCKMHELDNLYVVDSSLVATGGLDGAARSCPCSWRAG